MQRKPKCNMHTVKHYQHGRGRKAASMEAHKTLPPPDAVLYCATQSSYSDRTPRFSGPKSAAVAHRMLTGRPGRPRKQPLPSLRPVLSACDLRQMSGRQRRARRERRCLMIFNPLLTCVRLRNTGRARGHESAHDLCRALREAAVGTCTAIRWAGGR